MCHRTSQCNGGGGGGDIDGGGGGSGATQTLTEMPPADSVPAANCQCEGWLRR